MSGPAMERVKGIEPSSSAWKAVALPLSYTRGRRAICLRRKGSTAKDGGGGRTRTYEGVRQRIYSPPPLPLGTLPRRLRVTGRRQGGTAITRGACYGDDGLPCQRWWPGFVEVGRSTAKAIETAGRRAYKPGQWSPEIAPLARPAPGARPTGRERLLNVGRTPSSSMACTRSLPPSPIRNG